jgi:energy-coupling factor transporter ATP-binding protein EcfA2
VAAAAERLGLDAAAARATLADARSRLGFPGSAFVLALAGGTGAGKSSLLNALAGKEISPAGPLRPVTTEPVAWVPADAAGELGPLLRWVGVRRVVGHHDARFADLCLLDLPDYDSVERSHRATVDQLLPRVDAVCCSTRRSTTTGCCTRTTCAPSPTTPSGPCSWSTGAT